jgi:hypothetical protein
MRAISITLRDGTGYAKQGVALFSLESGHVARAPGKPGRVRALDTHCERLVMSCAPVASRGAMPGRVVT